MRIIFVKPSLVVFFEGVHREADLTLGETKPAQNIPCQLKRRKKGLPLDILDAKVHKLMDMPPVPRPRVDRHMRKIGFYELRRFERFLDIVKCQHKSPRFADFGRLENCKAARIAEIAFISFVAELI